MSRIPSFGALAALATLLLMTGCAGPAKLAERSEDQLVAGDHWKAWNTAIRALDKAPANDRARAAARAASASISSDWQRRITAIAAEDSIAAAEQVLELASFRAGAARYGSGELEALVVGERPPPGGVESDRADLLGDPAVHRREREGVGRAPERSDVLA
jgi:hypothetical protein